MNVDQFLKRVVFMTRNFGNYDLTEVVKLCLMDIDMPADLDGFKYLVYGVVYFYHNPDAMITKHVYPAIAKEFGCRPTDVEVSIRRAVFKTWKRRNEKWVGYFSETRRVTNSEFISNMAQVLKFWENCRNSMAVEGVEERD